MATKMLPQLKCSSSQPPTIGPSAIATPALAPHKPMARARSARPVKTLEISESVAGKVIAAPSPITARAAISCPGLVVKPPATLAVPNTARPGQQHALAAEAIGQAAEGQQQGGEDQVVGVHHPLQLGRGGVQLPDQAGQRDVHQRGVQVDGERGEQQRRENHGLRSHS